MRITSIDRGHCAEISRIEELADLFRPPSEFAIVKAVLVLSCLGPGAAAAAGPCPLRQMFASLGGGLELTTLAAVPQGSGLGTSSIMGAVVLAVLDRVMGRATDERELFHRVLRLEQSMATGGGWQDQIGGVVQGMKLVTAPPGMVPNVDIRFLPEDAIEAAPGGEQVLLYYTGITRLAKNILERVVAGFLDREPTTMASLRQLRALSAEAAAAIARRDVAAVGGIIDAAWELNKQLDPNCTSEAIEAMLARLRPHLYGAKLLGAGGGGFLLMCCKSPAAAAAARGVGRVPAESSRPVLPLFRKSRGVARHRVLTPGGQNAAANRPRWAPFSDDASASPPVSPDAIRAKAVHRRRRLRRKAEHDEAVRDHALRQAKQLPKAFHPLRPRIDARPDRTNPRA